MDIARVGLNDLLYMLKGTYTTVKLCGVSLFLGGMLGILVGIARSNHKIRAIRWVAATYIEIFRGIPLLLQLMLGYFGADFVGYNLPRFLTISVVLCLYTGAYLGEIFRSGLESIHREQWEAAASLGFTYIQSLRYVIIPQGIRVIIPSIIGFLVALVKATSLVSVVSVVDLTLAARRVSERAYVPLLAMGAAGLIYFLLCFPLSRLGKKLEKLRAQKE